MWICRYSYLPNTFYSYRRSWQSHLGAFSTLSSCCTSSRAQNSNCRASPPRNGPNLRKRLPPIPKSRVQRRRHHRGGFRPPPVSNKELPPSLKCVQEYTNRKWSIESIQIYSTLRAQLIGTTYITRQYWFHTKHVKIADFL